MFSDKKKLLDFTKTHYNYHLAEGIEYAFLFKCCFLIEDFEEAKKMKEKALFHLPFENNEIFQYIQKKEINNQSDLQLFKQHVYLLNNKHMLYDDNNLKQVVNFKNLFQLENFTEAFVILKEVNKNTAELHYKFHLFLANEYYELALQSVNNEMFSEARYFLQKALETDKRNPNNSIYEAILNENYFD